MTTLAFKLIVCTALAVAPVGCGSSIDPEPENQSGAESQEFEHDDLEAAESASRLVEIYCDGGVSEAQVVGCLSHVTDDVVCEADTSGKQQALSEYREENGDEGVCD